MLRHEVAGLVLALALLGAGCNGSTAAAASRPPVPQAQPGDDAFVYVSGESYPSLLVEVSAIAGASPSTDALAKMVDVFQRRLAKPAGVRFVLDPAIPPTQAHTQWSIGDIMALESQYRRAYTGDAEHPHEAVIWIVYLGGASEFDQGTTRALGLAFEPSSMAVFRDNIDRTTSPDSRSTVEAMVLVHEGGHMFGLVNNGLVMVDAHEDTAHPRHDVNPSCVMFHEIDTATTQMLQANPTIDFCYECRLDIFHAGGPAPGPPDSTATRSSPIPAPVSPSTRGSSGAILDAAVERPAGN